ncbi:hypothetical protein TcBrA4_0050420 [Trypanosoma cruzi]|nr:hypothetical protein TcBrA4_0050420 [Trypanosoma cruzi]
MGCRAQPEDQRADRSGAALFCIASHRQSDEDTATIVWRWDPTRQVPPVRLLGNAIGRHLNFGLHVTVAAMWTVSRRHQLRLDAELGHPGTPRRRGNRTVSGTHSPPRLGSAAPATAALHRSAHAHQRRILLSTWPPIQHRCGKILWFPRTTKHNASHFFDLLRTCVARSAWRPFLRQY